MALRMTDFKVFPVDPEIHTFVHPQFHFVGAFQPGKRYPVYFAGKTEEETRENARSFLRVELTNAGHSKRVVEAACRDQLPAVRKRTRVQPVAQEAT